MEDYKRPIQMHLSSHESIPRTLSCAGMVSESEKATRTEEAVVRPAAQPQGRQSTRPVFVVGCERSGTTLLYHMILSSGDFALFPFESDTFSLLGAKFPDLSSLEDRKRLLDFYVRSRLFTRSGLDLRDIEAKVLNGCRSVGDLLRIVMEELCRKQGVHRWAEKTPDHALRIAQIKRSFPDALVVHIIRDGRDVALSLANFGRVRPFFWAGDSQLIAFGVYWKWIVRKGREAGRRIGRDYYELHYEDLVEKPRETLAKLGDFIGHDLDYDRIQQVGVGSVRKPETSFQNLIPIEGFNPVGRWKKQLSSEDLARFEGVVGDCLEEMKYPIASRFGRRQRMFSAALSGFFFWAQYELRHWLKTRTPLRRLVGRRRQL